MRESVGLVFNSSIRCGTLIACQECGIEFKKPWRVSLVSKYYRNAPCIDYNN